MEKTQEQRKQNAYIHASEIKVILKIGKGKAYELVRQLNRELTSQGVLCYMPGRTLRRYFYKRMGLDDSAEDSSNRQ